MTSAKPSHSLLRAISDEAVLRALMKVPRATRAEVAAVTQLSKPTVAESVRRLEIAGLVVDTGERTSSRGGVGSYYTLSGEVGVAVAISVAPAGVVVERVDAAGAVTARHLEPIGRPASPRTVARLLTRATSAVLTGVPPSAVRVAMVSAADPVDRSTGALVHLPDAPFLLGRLSPPKTLASLIDGPVLVDNDVNWAARAERAARASGESTLDDFVYLHLGEGLGCAVVTDGEVRRGHNGLAGEIAHVTTTSRSGHAVAFTQVFDQLGLRHPDSTAIDVEALRAAVSGSRGRTRLTTIAAAVGDVITASIAFCDPQLVVIGGEWGVLPGVYDAVRARAAGLARSVPIDVARAPHDSSLLGARTAAAERLQADIVRRSR